MSKYDFSSERNARKAMWGMMMFVMVVLLALGFGLLLQLLWNTVVTDLFGIREIGFWEAIGLFILAKLFFGFGVGGGKSSRHRDKSKTSDPEDLRSIAKSDAFKRYWADEGRDAYDAFRKDVPES